jgi:hypothetical protein
MESLVGKSLKNEQNVDFIVLSEFSCKGIPCAYAMKIEKEEKEGIKQFFQVTNEEHPSLMEIKSEKMIKNLVETLEHQMKEDAKPRKIREDESISQYLAYLDDFYRSRIVTIL